jgi:hypothetical protein
LNVLPRPLARSRRTRVRRGSAQSTETDHGLAFHSRTGGDQADDVASNRVGPRSSDDGHPADRTGLGTKTEPTSGGRSPSAPDLLAFVDLPRLVDSSEPRRPTGNRGRRLPSATVRGKAVTWSAVAMKSGSVFAREMRRKCLKEAEGGMPSIVRQLTKSSSSGFFRSSWPPDSAWGRLRWPRPHEPRQR